MAGFDAAWELDLFGKYQRSLEAARDDAEAQMELRNAVLITVIADVACTYLDIRALQMRLEIARKDVAAATWSGSHSLRRASSWNTVPKCRRI